MKYCDVGPAFPTTDPIPDGYGGHQNVLWWGVSWIDNVAKSIAQGLAANPECGFDAKEAAEFCYDRAVAMAEEKIRREKSNAELEV